MDNEEKKDSNFDNIVFPVSKRLRDLQDDFKKHRTIILKSGIPLIISKIMYISAPSETSTEAFYINMYFLDELTLNKKGESNAFYDDMMRFKSLKKDNKKTTLIENISTFNNNIMKNIFLVDSVKNNIAEIFFKSTRINFILQRFIRRFKHRKLTMHDMNMDLCMNPLEEFKDKHKITLVENRTIYNFRLTDLLNIIKRALSNYDDICIVNPLSVKNPYTNLEFSKSNLYNIFFKTTESGLLLPVLFYKFFLCEFDIAQFTMENDTYLMNLAITDYVKETSNYEIYQEILSMLESYKRSLIKSVDLYKFIEKKTPQEVVDICREMLRLHYITKLSNSALSRSTSYRKLRILLINFEKEYKEHRVVRRFSVRSPTRREMGRITRAVRGEGGRILGRVTRGEPQMATSVSNTLLDDDGSGVGGTGEGEGDDAGDIGDVGGLASEGDVNIVLPTLQPSQSSPSISPSLTTAVQQSQMDYAEIIDDTIDRITANLESVMTEQTQDANVRHGIDEGELEDVVDDDEDDDNGADILSPPSPDSSSSSSDSDDSDDSDDDAL